MLYIFQFNMLLQDGSAEVLTSFISCSTVVCPNGKAGYTLPGQCCESCSEFSYNHFVLILNSCLFPFQDYDVSFDQAIATGTSQSATTILQPTWGEWSNWTACSRTCGDGGRQSRVRECLSDGRTNLNCTGPRIDVQDCNTQCCPGLF